MKTPSTNRKQTKLKSAKTRPKPTNPGQVSPEQQATDLNQRIARRVASLRKQLGISLDALASQCKVSRSMISLIERGESSPTAVVLEKIASGLNVSLASLFEETSASLNPIARKQDRSTWQDPDSGYIRRNISPANFPSPIQIVEVVLPAGASVAYESGPRQTNLHEQIWVQKGTLEVTLGETLYSLSDDECLAMHLNQPTSFHNPTGTSTHYVLVISSERFPTVARGN